MRTWESKATVWERVIFAMVNRVGIPDWWVGICNGDKPLFAGSYLVGGVSK